MPTACAILLEWLSIHARNRVEWDVIATILYYENTGSLVSLINKYNLIKPLIKIIKYQ